MNDPVPASQSLRVFCVEDNPLIALHLEMLIEEVGHVFAGSADSFSALQCRSEGLDFDVALVDIDLADGRTGGDLAAWLRARGCPTIFATGQELLAATYRDIAVGVIIKPVTAEVLATNLHAIPKRDGESLSSLS